jgi:hypothetical protein
MSDVLTAAGIALCLQLPIGCKNGHLNPFYFIDPASAPPAILFDHACATPEDQNPAWCEKPDEDCIVYEHYDILDGTHGRATLCRRRKILTS